MEQRFRSNHSAVYPYQYHPIWRPKYRREVLVDGVDVRLKGIVAEVAEELSVGAIELDRA
jgi:putative transposase